MTAHIFKHYWLYFTTSLAVFVVGLVMIAQGGLKPSIDFSGGSVLEVKMDVSKINSSQELEERIDKIVDISSLQLTSQKTLILKSKSIANEQKDAVVADLGTEFGTVEMIRFETVGPVIGRAPSGNIGITTIHRKPTGARSTRCRW